MVDEKRSVQGALRLLGELISSGAKEVTRLKKKVGKSKDAKMYYEATRRIYLRNRQKWHTASKAVASGRRTYESIYKEFGKKEENGSSGSNIKVNYRHVKAGTEAIKKGKSGAREVRYEDEQKTYK